MTLLEAANQLLNEAAMMDAGVNSLETPEGQRAEQMLERVRLSVLAQGKPFNTEIVNLTVNDADEVVVPSNYLAVQLPCPYVVKSRKVWDPRVRSFKVARSFTSISAAMDIPFDQLPQIPAEYIAWEATRRFCASTYGASSDQYAYCAEEARRASVALSVEYPVQVSLKYGSRAVRQGAYSGRGRYSPGYAAGESAAEIRWCTCGG